MTTLQRTLIAIGLLVILIAIFIFSFILNKRTPKPEGCQDLSDNCEGCQITSCSNHKKFNNIEEKKEG